MNTLFGKIDGKTYMLNFEKNTSVSVQEILIKLFDKYFQDRGYGDIIKMSSSNKNNFLKCCYFRINGKSYRFREEYYFDSSELKDRSMEITYISGVPPKFDEYTLNKINEVILDS